MTTPGWYPDPLGDYAHRFWDGTTWSELVANGRYQTMDPVDGGGLPATEDPVWGDGKNYLTTLRVWVADGHRRGITEELPLWAVGDVEVRANGADVNTASGQVAVIVRYAGYTGRTNYVMSHIPAAHAVGALVRKWANRNRRYYQVS